MKTNAVSSAPRRRAFTLIEIMVVVGIIGLVMAMGAPTLLQALHQSGFRKTISDFNELCITARRQAILRGVKTELFFHPQERRCEFDGASVQFGDDVVIEMLDINLLEFKEAEWARVRFFPNGTSDEMTFVVRNAGGDRPEWRMISLESTTALPRIDSDPQKWMSR